VRGARQIVVPDPGRTLAFIPTGPETATTIATPFWHVAIASRLLACALTLLLAGCVLPSGEDRFPPHNETKSQEYPNFENLVVRGTLSGEGGSLSLDATARSEGPHTYKVSSICAPSWSDNVVSSLGEVHRRPPPVQCAAWGLEPFRPGESIPFHATWNGTLWDSDKESYVDAAAGPYTWHLLFHAYKGGSEDYEFESEQLIPIEFTVTVK
jgi:hypothetical protein